eukprot:1991161-Pleurochrysis_carterae.AAC.4
MRQASSHPVSGCTRDILMSSGCKRDFSAIRSPRFGSSDRRALRSAACHCASFASPSPAKQACRKREGESRKKFAREVIYARK